MNRDAKLVWRKASRSSDNGGDCIEVAAEPKWRKSTRSADNGGACVEAAAPQADAVIIRDTKDCDYPGYPTLYLDRPTWIGLLDTLKSS